MPELWTLPEAAKLAGVEYRTLHSWVKREIVVPLYPAKGTGFPARLGEREVAICKLLGRLREAGCDLDVLLGAARALQGTPGLMSIELHRLGDVVIAADLYPSNGKLS